MNRYIPLVLLLSLVPARAIAEPLSKAIVNGEVFSVNGNADQGIVYSYAGHAFTPDDTAAFAGVHSILEDNSHIYVVTIQSGGGSNSSPQFRIFDVSNSKIPIMSDIMGQDVGDIFISDWRIKDGSVFGEFRADDGEYTLECYFKDGKTEVKKIPYAEKLEGPDRVPGGDYAIYANEKPILLAFTSKALSYKLKSILPDDVYKEARKMAFETNNVFFTPSHGVVSAKTFKKYDTGEWISIAVDHSGRLFAGFSWGDNKAVYYGNPDELTKLAL